jgi:hypothetical protein
MKCQHSARQSNVEGPPRRSLGREVIADITIALRPCGKAKPFRKSGGRGAPPKPSLGKMEKVKPSLPWGEGGPARRLRQPRPRTARCKARRAGPSPAEGLWMLMAHRPLQPAGR